MRRASEFVILAPEQAHNALVYARERLRCYLVARFPEYRFSLAKMAHDGAAPEAFVVVPVVGEVGGDTAEQHWLEVPEDAIDDIREALEAFELHAAMLH